MALLARCIRLVEGGKSRLRNLYFRMLGVRLGGYVWMRRIRIPRNYTDIELGANVSLDEGVVLLCAGEPTDTPRIRIGAGTYINRYTILDSIQSLEIGAECAIGPGSYLTDHDHGHTPGVAPLSQPLVAAPTRLGDRVWLGAHVVVLKGVTIGDGAVIGAGSVVTKDIPPHAVAVGTPARVVRIGVQEEAPVGR